MMQWNKERSGGLLTFSARGQAHEVKVSSGPSDEFLAWATAYGLQTFTSGKHEWLVTMLGEELSGVY